MKNLALALLSASLATASIHEAHERIHAVHRRDKSSEQETGLPQTTLTKTSGDDVTVVVVEEVVVTEWDYVTVYVDGNHHPVSTGLPSLDSQALLGPLATASLSSSSSSLSKTSSAVNLPTATSSPAPASTVQEASSSTPQVGQGYTLAPPPVVSSQIVEPTYASATSSPSSITSSSPPPAPSPQPTSPAIVSPQSVETIEPVVYTLSPPPVQPSQVGSPAPAHTDVLPADAVCVTSRCSASTTVYDPSVGLGACGKQFQTTDLVLALPVGMMGPLSNTNPYCWQNINLYLNGKMVTGQVVDKCMGCRTIYDLDLSPGLCEALGGVCDGVTQGVEWEWA